MAPKKSIYEIYSLSLTVQPFLAYRSQTKAGDVSMSAQLKELKRAVREDLARPSGHRRYYEFVHQIAAYEYGVGPRPTVDDFLKWRCNAEVRNIDLRRQTDQIK